jgi:hypothetical protein
MKIGVAVCLTIVVVWETRIFPLPFMGINIQFFPDMKIKKALRKNAKNVVTLYKINPLEENDFKISQQNAIKMFQKHNF